MTAEEYLEWEAKQEFRHEDVDGEILAMTRESFPCSLKPRNFVPHKYGNCYNKNLY